MITPDVRERLMEIAHADDDADELVEALRELTKVQEARKPATLNVDVAVVARAILEGAAITLRVADAIDGVRQDIAGLREAIAGLHMDAAGIIGAIEENTKAQRATAEAILRPRTIIKDQFGEIRGIGPKDKN